MSWYNKNPRKALPPILRDRWKLQKKRSTANQKSTEMRIISSKKKKNEIICRCRIPEAQWHKMEAPWPKISPIHMAITFRVKDTHPIHTTRTNSMYLHSTNRVPIEFTSNPFRTKTLSMGTLLSMEELTTKTEVFKAAILLKEQAQLTSTTRTALILTAIIMATTMILRKRWCSRIIILTFAPLKQTISSKLAAIATQIPQAAIVSKSRSPSSCTPLFFHHPQEKIQGRTIVEEAITRGPRRSVSLLPFKMSVMSLMKPSAW